MRGFELWCRILTLAVISVLPAQSTVIADSPPIYIELTVAPDLALPKAGILQVPVKLRVVNTTDRLLSLDEPNGCKAETWAVTETNGTRSERTLPNGESGSIYDPVAVENHTFCPASAPGKSMRMGPHEVRTMLVKLPFDAAVYQNGRTYILNYTYWGAGNLATFTVHKPH